MKKVLMLASVPSMIGQFNMSNINILQNLGYEIHVACNFKDESVWNQKRIQRFIQELKNGEILYHQIDFTRSVKQIKMHYKAYKQVSILLEKDNYDFIHCHTPIGGVCGRLIGKKNNSKVIYTAHGFHFFKGAPLKNWILYYPVEKFLSKYTDILITINKEDYQRAKAKFKAKRIEYIPGVGIDTKKFIPKAIDKNVLKDELSIPRDAVVLISVGELQSRKNHITPIKALSQLDSNIYYIICGQGKLKEDLQLRTKELGVEKQVKFLGYRSDIDALCGMADIYIFPSRREGLGIAALEGMAAGLPLISSDINGIKDYTKNGMTGYCLEPLDVKGFQKAIYRLSNDAKLRRKMGHYNQEIAKKFDIKNTNEIMMKIYKGFDQVN